MLLKDFTQVGKSHVKNNVPCQDSVNVFHDHDLSIISVSDGAGSKKLSHHGSKFIVQTLTKNITESFDDWYQMIKENQFSGYFDDWIKSQLALEVDRLNSSDTFEETVSIEDLSSTLVLYAEKDKEAFTIHVGDGAIVGIMSDYKMEILSYPENGEFSNVTFFVTTENNEKHVRSQTVDPDNYLGIFCMTDGAEDIYLDKKNKTVIKGLYYVAIDSLKRPQKFEDEFQVFLKTGTPTTVQDDIGIGFLLKDELIDINELETAYNAIQVEKPISENEDDEPFVLSSNKEAIIEKENNPNSLEQEREKQSARDHSNALNPKHFAFYTSRGYSKKEAVRKAKEFKGFKISPTERTNRVKKVVHVCSECLSENIHKIEVYLTDQEDDFLGEYVAKKCEDCNATTILYKDNG